MRSRRAAAGDAAEAEVDSRIATGGFATVRSRAAPAACVQGSRASHRVTHALARPAQVFKGRFRGQPVAFKVVPAAKENSDTASFCLMVLRHECDVLATVQHECAWRARPLPASAPARLPSTCHALLQLCRLSHRGPLEHAGCQRQQAEA